MFHRLLFCIICLSLTILVVGCSTIPNPSIEYYGEKNEAGYRVGKYEFANGTYHGELKDGDNNGRGTLIYRHFPAGLDPHTLSDYIRGLKDDKGNYTWPKGYKYTGSWKDGKKDGFGVEESRGLHIGNFQKLKYIGEFKNGSYTGVGAYVGLEGNWFPISDSYYRDNYHFKELKSSEYIVLSKVEDMTVDEVENYLKEEYPQFTGFE